MRDCTVRAPPDFRCNHKAAAPSSPTPSFSAKGAPGGGVDAKASGEESQQGLNALHQLCDGAHGEETSPRPYGPPLLRALATLVKGCTVSVYLGLSESAYTRGLYILRLPFLRV